MYNINERYKRALEAVKKLKDANPSDEGIQNWAKDNFPELCIGEAESMNDTLGDYEFVDLSLPSGTLWATKNVGARSETDYGLYFQWGDTQGYTASQVGTGEGQKAFNWTDYKHANGYYDTLTKYNSTDGLTTLVPEDDAATVNMGGNWHMPTKAQLEELWSETGHEWVMNYNGSSVNGMLFTSRSDSSKTLFFPASGYCWGGDVYGVGSYGYCWSSGVNSAYLSYAWYMSFFSGGGGMSNYCRPRGFVVRGVWAESSSSSE